MKALITFLLGVSLCLSGFGMKKRAVTWHSVGSSYVWDGGSVMFYFDSSQGDTLRLLAGNRKRFPGNHQVFEYSQENSGDSFRTLDRGSDVEAHVIRVVKSSLAQMPSESKWRYDLEALTASLQDRSLAWPKWRTVGLRTEKMRENVISDSSAHSNYEE